MAPKLKTLSGTDVVHILESFGFGIYNQKSSHIKLRRVSAGVKETLIIPNHKVIARGTLKAIINQASAYIRYTDLHSHFYTD